MILKMRLLSPSDDLIISFYLTYIAPVHVASANLNEEGNIIFGSRMM